MLAGIDNYFVLEKMFGTSNIFDNSEIILLNIFWNEGEVKLEIRTARTVDEGLIISTEECLQLLSLQQNICLASRPKDWVDTSAEAEVKAAKDAAFDAGLADYIGHGGGGAKPSYSEGDKLAAAFQLYGHMIGREFKNNVVISSMWDLGTRIASLGADTSEEKGTPKSKDPFSTGMMRFVKCNFPFMDGRIENALPCTCPGDPFVLSFGRDRRCGAEPIAKPSDRRRVGGHRMRHGVLFSVVGRGIIFPC